MSKFNSGGPKEHTVLARIGVEHAVNFGEASWIEETHAINPLSLSPSPPLPAPPPSVVTLLLLPKCCHCQRITAPIGMTLDSIAKGEKKLGVGNIQNLLKTTTQKLRHQARHFCSAPSILRHYS